LGFPEPGRLGRTWDEFGGRDWIGNTYYSSGFGLPEERGWDDMVNPQFVLAPAVFMYG
jgi:hypothetical protein